jgi:hypothetical protein
MKKTRLILLLVGIGVIVYATYLSAVSLQNTILLMLYEHGIYFSNTKLLSYIPITLAGLSFLSLWRPALGSLPLLFWVGDFILSLRLETKVLALSILSLLFSFYIVIESIRPAWKHRLLSVKKLAVSITVYLTLAALFSTVIWVVIKYYTLLLSPVSNFKGDVLVFLRSIEPTLLFQSFLLVLSLYIAVKVATYFSDIILSYFAKGSGGLSKFVLEKDYSKWKRSLVFFSGRQQGVMRESIILLYSILFSPAIFPIIREFVAIMFEGLSNDYRVLIYTGTSIMISWIFTRIVLVALLAEHSLPKLVKPPNPSIYLVFGLLGAIAVIYVYVMLGGSLSVLLKTVATGKRIAPDPVAKVIEIKTFDKRLEYFIDFYIKGFQTAIRILWG